MKRNNNFSARRNLSSNSKRRQLLKRVHQKVIARRQQFQVTEMAEDYAKAC
jgi:hypothetical protein